MTGVMSVFCHPMSEFIRMSCCSRKMMVASKDTRSYIGLGQSPTSSLRDRSSACSSVECSEVLTMGYARRVKEVGEWGETAQMKS
jgi:hypothetical protein